MIETAGPAFPLLARRLIVDAFVMLFDVTLQVIPSGSKLQLGFGGEGPHPKTDTLQKVVATIPLIANKTYGIKGMIWKTASGIHQETWYDDGSGWKKAGV